VINEATCTGCTACAQSCPYGAIDMIEIEPEAPTFKKHFKARLEKRDALKFGPGTPRVARARRIANKCDHCIAYGDQACVSACPTGSLIEINAYDLFRERSPKMQQLAYTGFNSDLTKKDRKEVLPVLPFIEGLAIRSGGIAKMKRAAMHRCSGWSASSLSSSRSAKPSCAVLPDVVSFSRSRRGV
jgi:Fe-S-cluster-containing dehydrogenase component